MIQQLDVLDYRTAKRRSIAKEVYKNERLYGTRVFSYGTVSKWLFGNGPLTGFDA